MFNPALSETLDSYETIFHFPGRSLQAMCTVIVYETVLVFNTILVADLGCIPNGKIVICCS